MRSALIYCLFVSLVVLSSDTFCQTPLPAPPINLKRQLLKVDIKRPTWPQALNVLLNRVSIPFLLELDMLSYRSQSMMHGKTEGDVTAMLYRVDLKDVTVEDAIKSILKDHPNYRYEVIDGAVLHIYPVGIQDRPDWPLNTVTKHFAVEQKDLTKHWRSFEDLVDPLRIDLRRVYGDDFAHCLSPRVFEGVTLRQVLIELAKTCRVYWIIEPLPLAEVKIRRTDWGDAFYPQGQKIEARGGDWYELLGLPISSDSVVNGVVR